ncbi:hypothetical protein [Youngiibacter fragilis]|uniref:Uncharacterized protein n=1 Tax=Youngiibacter fragilis 232.1 TaxID=994573 RepID=V7I231_9CLOT|nr:hypothetical protein [Youngiibacter fragilis]ETA79933.1 hypothetical protein T472_0214405 [Youngiibacter fragilis 232.1]
MRKLRLIAAGIVMVAAAAAVYMAFFRELPGPPGLEAKSTLGTARAIMGTYGWDYGNRSVQADSMHPTKFQYRPENILQVAAGEKITIYPVYNDKFYKGSLELFDFEVYSVQGTEVSPSGGVAELKGSTITAEVPEASGDHILVMIIRYQQGSVSYGLKVSSKKEAPMKGLELYIFRDGGKVVYSLLVGTNRNKTEEEITGNPMATDSLEDIRMQLGGFADSFVTIYQMPGANFTEAEYLSIEDELTDGFGHEFNAAGVWSR